MTLTFCWDLSAADWIAHSDLPWSQLVSFGPAGFDAYARLRFLPDPVRPGKARTTSRQGLAHRPAAQALRGAGHPHHDPEGLLLLRLGRLRPHAPSLAMTPMMRCTSTMRTTPPRWRSQAPVRGWRPNPLDDLSMTHLPKVVVPHRAYWLFRGPLAEVGTWDTAGDGRARSARRDRTCVRLARRSRLVRRLGRRSTLGRHRRQPALITQLTADPRLDVVPADPTKDQPFYL